MVLGLIEDIWYKWVADVGITGADNRKGRRYLILPPDYTELTYLSIKHFLSGNQRRSEARFISFAQGPVVSERRMQFLIPGRCSCRIVLYTLFPNG